MSDVKWIKITTDIFDDEKIALIESLPDADTIITIWFKLLVLAGKQNNGGIFILNDRIPYTDEMLATLFRRQLNTVRMALNTFEKFGMIAIIDGVITIPNWEKHQNIEGMEKIREQNRLRVERYREKQKLLLNGNANCNVTVTECNALDKDKEIEIDNNPPISPKRGRRAKPFVKPTPEEVQAYCDERGNGINGEEFCDSYEAKGWLIGKTPMKDWKAAVRTWEKKRGFKPKDKPVINEPPKQERINLWKDEWDDESENAI